MLRILNACHEGAPTATIRHTTRFGKWGNAPGGQAEMHFRSMAYRRLVGAFPFIRMQFEVMPCFSEFVCIYIIFTKRLCGAHTSLLHQQRQFRAGPEQFTLHIYLPLGCQPVLFDVKLSLRQAEFTKRSGQTRRRVAKMQCNSLDSHQKIS